LDPQYEKFGQTGADDPVPISTQRLGVMQYINLFDSLARFLLSELKGDFDFFHLTEMLQKCRTVRYCCLTQKPSFGPVINW